ncbi:MAG: hypothetical protein DRQ49_16865 [Gammaproteobacteria bacterium]|nr:MAG: hypothetical protein DRQ49_16865 [Gammaproteobacteria bacterium]RKZ39607.1 MAG: hypothetical protein DRQ41_10370 [Gammaproteobacteria bacterium]RKZ71482.1 MAG: hypothetical protein DRQ57_18620 [Gammaproteobacteria bacterium]
MSYSFHNLAFDVLKKATSPLTYQQIWERATDAGLTEQIKSKGKTPWQTLGARLYVDIRDNEFSKFVKVGKRPARFFLKKRLTELSEDIIEKIEEKEIQEKPRKTLYQERDLHSLLTYFVYANPSFSRGKTIFTKTIFHEKSKKQGFNEWLHPDMVGFYLPLDDWNNNVIEFNRLVDNNVIKIFSFELKKELSKGNYREAFFQAVSNSSWAHEGYLVAAKIQDDDDLLEELKRLSASFGIGIIHLQLTDYNSSSILFPAHSKPTLDWETINKLCEQNQDFDRFLQDVRIDFESKRIHKFEYDEIIRDPVFYIKEKLKIEQRDAFN